MNKKVKEPFLAARILNMVLGVTILALVLAVIYSKKDTDALKILIFALAAIENFIVATISFLEQKKIRGNVSAVICTIFLMIAAILAVRFFIFK